MNVDLNLIAKLQCYWRLFSSTVPWCWCSYAAWFCCCCYKHPQVTISRCFQHVKTCWLCQRTTSRYSGKINRMTVK